METTPLPYRHTQIAYATLIGLAAGLVTQTGSFINDLRRRRRRAWFGPLLIAVSAGLMYAFSTLTVEVRDDEVEVWFTSGLARRRVAVADITGVTATTVPWYTGWGIRRWNGGWLYNAWGRDAVVLSLTDGRRFSVGSDEPQLLMGAIEGARSKTAAA